MATVPYRNRYLPYLQTTAHDEPPQDTPQVHGRHQGDQDGQFEDGTITVDSLTTVLPACSHTVSAFPGVQVQQQRVQERRQEDQGTESATVPQSYRIPFQTSVTSRSKKAGKR